MQVAYTELLTRIEYEDDGWSSVCNIMHVPFTKVKDAFESFGKNEFRTILFLRDHLPNLAKRNTAA